MTVRPYTLTQFLKPVCKTKRKQNKSSLHLSQKMYFFPWISICTSMFHRTSSVISTFVANGGRTHGHLTPHMVSHTGPKRTRKHAPEKGQQVLGSELWGDFRDWWLGFLVCKSRRQKEFTQYLQGLPQFLLPSEFLTCAFLLLFSSYCSVLSAAVPPPATAVETRPQGPPSTILFSSFIFQVFLKLTSWRRFRYCPLHSCLIFLFLESPLGFRHPLISGAWLIWDLIPL